LVVERRVEVMDMDVSGSLLRRTHHGVGGGRVWTRQNVVEVVEMVVEAVVVGIIVVI
jgi:hypothetical protein